MITNELIAKGNNEGRTLPQTSADSLHNATLETAPQIAKACNVSRRTVDNWIKARKIPFIKIGASIRFHRPSVMAALSRFTIEPITTR